MSESLLSDVVVGRLDAAMVAEINEFPSTLRWRPFLRERLLVTAPPGTAPTSAAELLAKFPFVELGLEVGIPKCVRVVLHDDLLAKALFIARALPLDKTAGQFFSQAHKPTSPQAHKPTSRANPTKSQ